MGRMLAVIVVVLAAVAYVVVQLAVRPVPAVAATAVPLSATMPGAAATLSWPGQGEGAVGTESGGLLESGGAQTQTPLASVTKLMTAYVILHDHPLAQGAGGPVVTVNSTDVTTYEQDKAQGDSVVPVQAGEQLDELQLLEALLIPSGDNIAAMLAVWDSGSESAFVTKMNAAAKQLGLTKTHYVDPSGVAPGSESTATSQVRLAIADMKLPAFRTVVSMPQVTLPVAGVQYNVDAELGKDGIVGIKTGYTTSAGGCFVFASNQTVDGKPQTIVGAVLHLEGTAAQPSALTEAFDASTALLTSAQHLLEQATVLHAGQTLGHIDAAWAPSIALQATRSVTLVGLPGQHVKASVVLPGNVTAPIGAHQHLGTELLVLGDQRITVPLETSGPLPAATLEWRLTRV